MIHLAEVAGGQSLEDELDDHDNAHDAAPTTSHEIWHARGTDRCFALCICPLFADQKSDRAFVLGAGQNAEGFGHRE